jgi:thiol-disulfide isomerase/thioredoxin
MKNILLVFIMIIGITATAQTFRVVKDPETDGKMYNGLFTFDDLDRETSFSWLKKGKDDYKPADDKSLGVLQFYLRQYKIVIFLGTWCGDSRELVPKLEKVLEDVKYPMSKVSIYGVDRQKKTIGGEQKKYDITNVPTIILFKGDEEAGRIIESVKTTIEGDLAAIIEKDMEGQAPR